MRDVVERFFDGLTARNSAMVAATLHEAAVMYLPFGANPATTPPHGPVERLEGQAEVMAYFDGMIGAITCYTNPAIFLQAFPELAAEKFGVALNTLG
ncbi:nuclear transport factor 2-like protein [Flindersiella endophytica]